MKKDIGVQVEFDGLDGERVVMRFARPDLLVMDEISEKRDTWDKAKEAAKEGSTPPGFFQDIVDFLARYAPDLCLSHNIAVINGSDDYDVDADYFLVATKDVKVDKALLPKRLDAPAEMALFDGIMRGMQAVGDAVQKGAAGSGNFREDTLQGGRRPAGGDDEPAAE